MSAVTFALDIHKTEAYAATPAKRPRASSKSTTSDCRITRSGPPPQLEPHKGSEFRTRIIYRPEGGRAMSTPTPEEIRQAAQDIASTGAAAEYSGGLASTGTDR